jgi:hypothetical protein
LPALAAKNCKQIRGKQSQAGRRRSGVGEQLQNIAIERTDAGHTAQIRRHALDVKLLQVTQRLCPIPKVRENRIVTDDTLQLAGNHERSKKAKALLRFGYGGG